MPDMITIKAAPGTKVPREDKPTTYIADTTPVSVPASAYYRRRIADGDLIVLEDVQPTPMTYAGQSSTSSPADDGDKE